MTHIVGQRDRSEFVLDPTQAWRRGRVLDAMFSALRVHSPRGITRASHRTMNELDDQRQLAVARRLNSPR